MVHVVKGGRSKELVQKESTDGLSFSWTEDEYDNEGEKEEGVVDSHGEHNSQDITNEEENSENEGDSSKEKESDTNDRIGEQVNDSAKEETNSEEEGNYESEGDDQENISESE